MQTSTDSSNRAYLQPVINRFVMLMKKSGANSLLFYNIFHSSFERQNEGFIHEAQKKAMLVIKYGR